MDDSYNNLISYRSIVPAPCDCLDYAKPCASGISAKVVIIIPADDNSIFNLPHTASPSTVAPSIPSPSDDYSTDDAPTKSSAIQSHQLDSDAPDVIPDDELIADTLPPLTDPTVNPSCRPDQSPSC